MKKYSALLVTFLALGLLVAGAFAVQAKSNGTSPEIIKKTVKVNKEFTIVLSSNPTTGYSWNAKFDPSYIQLVSSSYKPNKTTSGIVGSGGVQIFKFKAVKPGKTEIVMQYKKSWENSPINEKTYKITITR